MKTTFNSREGVPPLLPSPHKWWRARVGGVTIFISLFVFLLPLYPARLFAGQPEVGVVTRTLKEVHLIREGKKGAQPVKQQDPVLFKDTYETGDKSRAKLLFKDDSLLTLGPKTKIEITESVYNPNKDYRSTQINLASGKVRALVGKAFTGSGSKFEVHTPTAVAAARGTHFVVGMINVDGVMKTVVTVLADGGSVSVTPLSSGPTVPGTPPPAPVLVTPGNFTTVAEGGTPTAPEAAPPSLMQELVNATQVDDQVEGEGGQESDMELAEVEQEVENQGSTGEGSTEGEGFIPASSDEDEGSSDETPDDQGQLEQETVTGVTDVELLIQPQCPPGVC